MGRPHPMSEHREEAAEPLEVHGEARRELEQYRPQAGPQLPGPGPQELHRVTAVPHPADVGDEPTGLDGDHEPLGGLLPPSGEGPGVDRWEPGGEEPQAGSFGQVSGVEAAPPVDVLPPARPDQLGHAFTLPPRWVAAATLTLPGNGTPRMG